MARLPRYVIPGQPQHIIQRGNNRQAIFAAVADYQFFRDALVEAAAEHGLAIHAYVWMTNHKKKMGSDTIFAYPRQNADKMGSADTIFAYPRQNAYFGPT